MREDVRRRADADAARYPASVSFEINGGWASLIAVSGRLVCGRDRVMGQPHPDPWRIGADVPGCDQSASRYVIPLTATCRHETSLTALAWECLNRSAESRKPFG